MVQLMSPPAHGETVSDVSDAHALTVSLLEGMSALEKLETEWRALDERATPESVFQSFEMVSVWCRHFLEDGQLRIVAVRLAGRLELIAPFVVRRKACITGAQLVGAPVSQYSSFVHADSPDAERLIRLAVSAIAASGLDYLVLDGVPDETPLADHLRHLGSKPVNARSAPYLSLPGDHDQTDHMRRRSRGFGKKMRAFRRQLEMEGPVDFKIIGAGATAAAALHSALALKREWMVREGLISTALIDAGMMACLGDIAMSCACCTIMLMTHCGRPVAARLGFERSGTYFAYLSSYDQSVAAASPGRQLMDWSIRTARQRGVETFDFLPPAGEHKSLWTDTARRVEDHIVAFSFKGRVWGVLSIQRLKPHIRSVWHRLPDPLRRFFAARMLKI
ncbi:hypothetical protein GCM10007989_19870 [Devosia pacifica]|uniref:BioF2-like acetyltransferase domain-containing protein n=1 Tax=Devosia pacifica TaxID=1335967 RepID=A0A918S6Q4_9HYPH|nr:GNAT family N-acetyltransferase [Devosia pacifica]GHA24232.1 hypothetical protein GCM10007989_19870 [Devosia pacifica]